MVRQRLFWLFVILAIPMASGAAGDLTFTFENPQFARNGVVIDSVSTNYPRLATMKFSFEGDNFDSIRVDTSELSENNPIETVRPGNGCAGGDEYTCTVDDILLKPATGSGNVYLTIKKGDQEVEETLPFSFTIDNDRPNVESISIQGCNSENCYIGQNSNITISLSENNFNNGFVFFYIGTRGPYMVRSCSGNTCWWKGASNCRQGESVSVSIGQNMGVPSQDDAGNPMNYNAGIREETFTCDRRNPEIGEITVESNTEGNVLRQGSLATFSFTVEEDSPPTVVANFEELGASEVMEVSCSEDGADYMCELQVNVNEPGYRKATVDFEVTDSAGNSAGKSIDVEILEEGQSDSDEDIWKVNSVKASPTVLNRKTLQMFEKNVLVDVNMGRNYGDPSVLSQELDRCVFENSDVSLSSKLLSQGKRPSIELTIPRDVWATPEPRLNVNCTIATTTRMGNTIIGGQERDTLRFNVKLDEFKDVPEKIKEELEKQQGEDEKIRKIVTGMGKWVNLATDMCSVANTLTQVADGAAKAEGGVCAASAVWPPARGVAEQLKGIADFSGSGAGQISNTFAGVCKFLTCQQSDLIGLENMAFESSGINDALGEINVNHRDLWRPEDNLYYSYATACLPGIIANLKKKAEIKCEYQRCIQQDVLGSGYPISTCQEVRDYNSCVYNRDQTIGFLATPIDNMITSVQNVISNPAALGVGVADYYCSSLTSCEGGHFACTISTAASTIATFKDIFSGIKRVGDYMSPGFSEGTACEQIEDMPDADFYNPLTDSPSDINYNFWKDAGNSFSNSVDDVDLESILPESKPKSVTLYKVGSNEYIHRSDGFHEVTKGRYSSGDTYYDIDPETSGVVAPEDYTLETVPAGYGFRENGEEVSYGEVRDSQESYVTEEDADVEEDAPDETPPEEAPTQEEISQFEVNSRRAEMADWLNKYMEQVQINYLVFGGDGSGMAGEAITQNAMNTINQRCSDFPAVCEGVDYSCLESMIPGSSCIENIKSKIQENEEQFVQNNEDMRPSVGKRLISAWRAALATSSFTSSWFDDSSYTQSVNEWFEDMNPTDEWVRNACELDVPVSLAVSPDRSTSARPALHVEGFKSGVEAGYEYIITSIVSPPATEAINFKLTTEGDGSRDLTEVTNLAPDQEPFARNRGDPITFTSENNFTRVCFNMLDGEPDDYNLNSNTYCNSIEEVE